MPRLATDLIEHIVAYLVSCDLHALSRLTRETLAERFQVNSTYLSTIFKQHTKRSLHAFIEMEKLFKARMLLDNEPNLTVHTLSLHFGIQKTTRFRAKFRNLFAMSPGAYRRLSRKKHVHA